uniref:PCI domain-containing protein n=1 Tax=Compsopogon caeruleus TaxID=31354 RepID=A0A7S1TB04_9RHOD|mmetsp:Transcript_15098/g.30669  ORF Transcript_15098/g.30669 Transcript_15098/m.30669 type:complete len:394 (+) Transcript_15098:211-1392(+)
MERNAASYIRDRGLAEEDADLKELFSWLAQCFDRKLWHQATEAILRLVRWEPQPPGDLIGIYRNYVARFETKMNLVALVEVVTLIAAREIPDPDMALEFLSLHHPECQPATPTSVLVALDPDAQVLLLSHIARLYIQKQDNASARASMDLAKNMVDAAHDMAPHIHSAYYRAAADLHKILGTASDFYHNALMYLVYTDPASLPKEEHIRWAVDLGVAALVSEDIFQFGDLMANSIISSLRETEQSWLLDLLVAFHTGSISSFEQICSTSSEAINDHHSLVVNAERIRQKITILALMALALEKTSKRTITYAEVAESCHVPHGEVEFLVMRALSLNLVSGVIDSVDETVAISRVQPRILDRSDAAVMAQKIGYWQTKVTEMLFLLEDECDGLLA